MRLFIAIPLSEEMKKALVTCMHDLKKQGVEGNYVPAQGLFPAAGEPAPDPGLHRGVR